MKALLLSAALALAPGALTPQEPARKDAGQADQQAAELSAPPKAPIAGMAGFRTKSRVVLGTDPEQVLRLEAYYVFPERVRWSLLPEGAAASERQLHFRFGESYWSTAPGEADSRPLDMASPFSSPNQTAIHMELRRAAMLWPDGLEWEGEGSLRSARSPVRIHVNFAPERLPLVLLAQLDDAGRPREMHVHWSYSDGQSIQALDTKMALRDITWREQGERWWPHAFTLVGCGEAEWHEAVESIDVGVNAADSFFVPPDRRDTSGLAASSAPLLVQLPPVVQRRVPLPEGTTWGQALAAGERCTTEEAERLEPLGGRLEPGLVLELDAHGAPRAVLLRLGRRPEPLPPGWEMPPPREAVTARRSGRGPVPSSALKRLADLLPSGAVPGSAYLRLAPSDGGGATCQLVQPFSRQR